MPGQRIDGTALGSLAAGSVLLYAGIKGKSIPSAVQAIVQGKSPATAQNVNQISQVTQVTAATANVSGYLGSASGQGIADWAVAQIGQWQYVFGGKPAQGQVDCSSLDNWGFGHVFGLAIPFLKAGGYDGTVHGPATWQWFVWPGCVTVGTDPKQALPGDLAIWDVHHMGICIGPDQMVSAENPTDGVQQSAITGFSSGAFAIRRHKALIQGTGTITPQQQAQNARAHEARGAHG